MQGSTYIKMSTAAADGQPDAERRAGRALRVAAPRRAGNEGCVTSYGRIRVRGRCTRSLLSALRSLIRQVDITLRINYILSQPTSLHLANQFKKEPNMSYL